MSHAYHCPRCSSGLTKTSRNLDFFCRSCFTSVVILGADWADIMGVEDATPTRIPVEACLRHPGTEPLVVATKTTPLGAMAS